MKRVIRYKVHADRVPENVRYIEQVFVELRRAKPLGVRYASFRFDDGVSFMHIVSYENQEASTFLAKLPAFQAFVAGVKERCVEPPLTTEMEEVASYGFFGEA